MNWCLSLITFSNKIGNLISIIEFNILRCLNLILLLCELKKKKFLTKLIENKHLILISLSKELRDLISFKNIDISGYSILILLQKEFKNLISLDNFLE